MVFALNLHLVHFCPEAFSWNDGNWVWYGKAIVLKSSNLIPPTLRMALPDFLAPLYRTQTLQYSVYSRCPTPPYFGGMALPRSTLLYLTLPCSVTYSIKLYSTTLPESTIPYCTIALCYSTQTWLDWYHGSVPAWMALYCTLPLAAPSLTIFSRTHYPYSTWTYSNGLSLDLPYSTISYTNQGSTYCMQIAHYGEKSGGW